MALLQGKKIDFMKRLKRLARLAGLVLLIVLAMTGVGIFGALFSNREKYENKPMNIEVKDKKDEEDEDQQVID